MEQLKKCKQDTCHVSEDGKCLEGLELKDCPHFYLTESEKVEVGSSETETHKNTVHLFSGEELSLRDSTIITYNYAYTLVGIIGNHDCGKTTLLATLFDKFQDGPIDNTFYFAGSYTQIGFEKKSHLSRKHSGLSTPQTGHTTNSEITLLHLALKKKNRLNQPAKHLLLTDVKGERFETARVSLSAMQELDLLSKCNFIIIVLDGRKLIQLREKNAVIREMKSFLKMALEAKVITANQPVKIVISKWDLIHQSGQVKIEEFVKSGFERDFEGLITQLTFAKIASRPAEADGTFEWGYGMAGLLEEWLGEEVETQTTVSKANNRKLKGRYFGSYIASIG